MKYVKTLFMIFVICSFGFFSHAEPVAPIIATPIKHATMVIQAGALTIYVDPVGEQEAFSQFPVPDFILITHTHYDHFAPELVGRLKTIGTVILGPEAVIEQLGYGTVINSGEKRTYDQVTVEAIPAYNITPERMDLHKKGQGNGYVLNINGKRIYISGDTEDIPEMRALKNIDHAFVCMNLPYTMTVEQAASAVLEFKPKNVYPYHFKGKNMISDLDKFKQMVGEDQDIKVGIWEWYPPDSGKINE